MTLLSLFLSLLSFSFTFSCDHVDNVSLLVFLVLLFDQIFGDSDPVSGIFKFVFILLLLFEKLVLQLFIINLNFLFKAVC